MFFSPFEQFELSKFVSFMVKYCPFSDSRWDLSFTNSSLYMLIALVIFIFTITTVISNASLNPKGMIHLIFSNLYRGLLNVVSGHIGNTNLVYFPFLATVFIFISSLNLIGMIPYSFTVTSHISITFALAFGICVSLFVLGLNLHGITFFKSFLPEGTPLGLVPILVPIELLSYLSHSVSLSVRLFANMLAGHALLKILSGFVCSMVAAGGILAIAAVAPFAVVFVLTGMEFCIAILQAYVFTVLTCIYLKDSIYPH